jgi:arginine repressor
MIMNNLIEVIKGTSKTVICTVTGLESLSGFTAAFIVKKNKTDSDSLKTFEVTGNIIGMDAIFVISASNNTKTASEYFFEIVLTNGSEVFSPNQGIYRIIQSVKY